MTRAGALPHLNRWPCDFKQLKPVLVLIIIGSKSNFGHRLLLHQHQSLKIINLSDIILICFTTIDFNYEMGHKALDYELIGAFSFAKQTITRYYTHLH